MSKHHFCYTLVGLITLLLSGCYYYDCDTHTEDFSRYTAYKTKVDFVEEKIQDTTDTEYSFRPLYYARVDDYIRLYAKKAAYEWYVDIYGCSSYKCKDAEKVIIHDETYHHSYLFKKGEFKISNPKNPDIKHEGDVFYHYFFNLKIDTKNVKIDWDIIEGTSEREECEIKEMGAPHIAG